MSSNATETAIGAVVLAVAAGFLVYASQAAGLGGGGGATYPLVAKFNSAEGLHVGTDIRLAGVHIGTVSDLELNTETYQAETRLAIIEGIKLPEDSEIIVSSEGLLGGTFVEISPGGAEDMLEPGAEILLTQSSVSILNLLIKFAAGSASGSDDAAQ